MPTYLHAVKTLSPKHGVEMTNIGSDAVNMLYPWVTLALPEYLSYASLIGYIGMQDSTTSSTKMPSALLTSDLPKKTLINEPIWVHLEPSSHRHPPRRMNIVTRLGQEVGTGKYRYGSHAPSFPYRTAQVSQDGSRELPGRFPREVPQP